MAITRSATAVWHGTGKEGKGTLTTQSGVLSGSQYGFTSRFENGIGTNPEELIAAAHSGCFAMALSFALSGAGYTPDTLKVDAKVALEKDGDGFRIPSVALTLHAKVPGISADDFHKIAADAKANCPVSKVLNATITLDANLDS